MKSLLSAAFVLLAPGSVLAASFDINLDEINGERILVVARSSGGAAAVAAGGEDLKVLRGEEAERAIASLARIEAPEPPAASGAGGSDGGKRKKKIVIHKMEIDEDDNGGGDRQIRVIRKTDGGRRKEELLQGDAEILIEGAPGGASVERRIIRMKGVDVARAIRFIDETKGLDAGERIEMKTAAGL